MKYKPAPEVITKLREYNRWRRGDEEIAQPDPGEIGRLLDAVCEMVGQLERERDLAEDERIDLAQQLQSEQERHAKCQNERDEAREEAKRLDGAYEDATNYYARIIRLTDELDEARAVANDLASAASHCLGWHDCRLRIGDKIAAALKRWRKSK